MSIVLQEKEVNITKKYYHYKRAEQTLKLIFYKESKQEEIMVEKDKSC